jgi:hypothetical protein
MDVFLRRLLEALDQGGDLDLFADLPVDEAVDVGVVEVEADHLGGAPGGAAALDRAGGAVADLQPDMRPEDLPPPERGSFSRGASRSWCRCRSRT